jgi:hypothetical protein
MPLSCAGCYNQKNISKLNNDEETTRLFIIGHIWFHDRRTH